MGLREYVVKNVIRGACTCGRCVDAPENPEEKQPSGHTADLIFFKVAQNFAGDADVGAFRALVEEEYPHWLDGTEHSYLEIGADVGDQGLALMTMGLGELLGVWKLLTPESIMPFLGRDLKLRMAQTGMITIRVQLEA